MNLAETLNIEAKRSWWRTPTGIALIGFALVAAFYGLREHWGHALGTLSYLLLLGCPLMHLFMHRGHHHHSGGSGGVPGARPGD